MKKNGPMARKGADHFVGMPAVAGGVSSRGDDLIDLAEVNPRQ
jgi:hypothetical protein